MCILFIYRNPDANCDSYRIILASNRDENFKRPASPAHYWKNDPECLGGMDMEPGKQGGTWLALSLAGKAGVILNLSSKEDSANIPKKGRGSLIPNFLTSNDSDILCLNKLHMENQNGQPHNPYALILINLFNANVNYLSSSIKSTGPLLCQDNILGFSNSNIDVPYKKVEMGKEIFRNIVNNTTVSKEADLIEQLIQFLKSKETYLPDTVLQNRYSKNYEGLSSIFVSIGEYRTRTHSILLVNGNNEITFVEETLMPDLTWKRQIFNNSLNFENR